MANAIDITEELGIAILKKDGKYNISADGIWMGSAKNVEEISRHVGEVAVEEAGRRGILRVPGVYRVRIGLVDKENPECRSTVPLTITRTAEATQTCLSEPIEL